MKVVFILVLILILAAILGMTGNTMRCMYANGNSCPQLCVAAKINCEGNFTQRCKYGGNVCQAPQLRAYYDFAKSHLNFKK